MKRIYNVIAIEEYGISSLAQTIFKKVREYQSQGYEINIHIQIASQNQYESYITILEIYKEE